MSKPWSDGDVRRHTPISLPWGPAGDNQGASRDWKMPPLGHYIIAHTAWRLVGQTHKQPSSYLLAWPHPLAPASLHWPGLANGLVWVERDSRFAAETVEMRGSGGWAYSAIPHTILGHFSVCTGMLLLIVVTLFIPTLPPPRLQFCPFILSYLLCFTPLPSGYWVCPLSEHPSPSSTHILLVWGVELPDLLNITYFKPRL